MIQTLLRSIITGSLIVLTCTCIARAQIAPGVQQAAKQTATVTGTVVTSDGLPVARASVQLNGAGARLQTVTDSHGNFTFIGVPFGTYAIAATATTLGTASRRGIAVRSDISIAIQYLAGSTGGMKEIARVSTQSSGSQINVTPASIASVNPSAFAFEGNLSWRELLDRIPGVTVGGGLNGGDVTNAIIPGSPFQPVILSINGALPYETSTTFDGMPLSNYTCSARPGSGVDLSTLPMTLFDAADVVRGPGANAPSIVDSAGGAFVLHAPGTVEKNAFQVSVSNDAFGGYNAVSKATLRMGKLSATAVYGFNNSPGPLGAQNRLSNFAIAPTTIDGNQVASGGLVQYYSNPMYGQCYCYIQTTLMVDDFPQSTAWRQHDGGLALAYQLSPTITVQAFYAGSQSEASQATFQQRYNFTPGSGYAGVLNPGNYFTGSAGIASGIEQSGGLFEEKATAYIGRGVLRLAALQNTTFVHQAAGTAPPGTYPLYGTGTYCDNPPSCTSRTAFVFNGTPATLAFPSIVSFDQWQSHNNDLLASYELQLGSTSALGLSYVKSANSGAYTYAEQITIGGVSHPLNSGAMGNFTTNEFRLHLSTQISDKLMFDGSYYATQSLFHVPNPNAANRWVDVNFDYSAPRLGATWRLNDNTVLRGAAGGGFALPPLFQLIGINGFPSCSGSPLICTETVTNIHVQPEKTFGIDVGADIRFANATVLSGDVYRTDLYGQLFQSVRLIGVDPSFNAPLYAQEYVNLAHSRFEGINLNLHHDVSHGTYWNVGLGLTRGYIVSVPAGFYNTLGGTCDFANGVNCQNTYAIPGQNFNGRNQSTVPYANGSAAIGYRWNPAKYIELDTNYYGNNNAYFVPAFAEFDARASYPLTHAFSLIATLRNITGIYGEPIQLVTVNPNLLAPSIAGQDFALFPIPFGPRTLIVTANLQL